MLVYASFCDCELKILENRENGYCREMKRSLRLSTDVMCMDYIFCQQNEEKFFISELPFLLALEGWGC
jgi:hypothetical protein